MMTWACDLADSPKARSILADIEKFGSIECVLFNAAREAGKPPLEETVEQIEQDFQVRKPIG